MASFDDREKAYERKYQQDQELAFKVRARRNRLFGLWAAEKLGRTGPAAEAYAGEIVAHGVQKSHDDALVEKVRSDLAGTDATLDATRIRLELERCNTEAKRQLGPPQ